MIFNYRGVCWSWILWDTFQVQKKKKMNSYNVEWKMNSWMWPQRPSNRIAFVGMSFSEHELWILPRFLAEFFPYCFFWQVCSGLRSDSIFCNLSVAQLCSRLSTTCLNEIEVVTYFYTSRYSAWTARTNLMVLDSCCTAHWSRNVFFFVFVIT